MRIGGLVGLTVGNLEAVMNDRLYKVTVYENEPEEYITFTTSEAKEKGMRIIHMIGMSTQNV